MPDAPGSINNEKYPIALDEDGNLQWQTVQVAQERDEVWEDWSLSMGETERITGRGHLFADGFDPSNQGVLRLSPFFQNSNNPDDFTTGYGYFMEQAGTVAETIAHDGTDLTATASASSVTISDYIITSGTNRIMIVGVSVNDPDDTGILINGTCTFDGIALTLLTTRTAGAGNVAACGIFYLLSPPIVTGDVVFTSGLPASDDFVIGATAYTGVDQNTPFGSTSSASSSGSTSPSVATTSATNELVVDVLSASNPSTCTNDAQGTERWNTNVSSATRGAASEEDGAASVTSSWTLGTSVAWAIIGAPLKQATTSGGQQFMFIADNDKITKYTYDSDSGLTDVGSITFSSGVAGRPAKMNGKWYLPLGSGSNARRLDDADNATPSSWFADAGWAANHLATFQQGVQPTLARANATTENTVDLNADTSGNVGDTWTQASEEVGDTSAKITDLVEAQGLLFVAKEDGLYRFGIEAESFPVIPFIDRGNIDPDNGKGTHSFGDIIFYPSNQGLWRYRIGGGALPVGVSTIRGFRRIPNINLNSSWPTDRRHAFVTHAGEWIYVQLNSLSWTTLLQMRLRREGDPEGHEFIINGVLEIPLNKGMGVDRNGRLWQKGASVSNDFRDIRVIELDAGGGTNVEDRRGQVSGTADIYFDERNPGRPQDKVQIRHMTVETEGDWDATTSLQLKLYRDNASSPTSIGSAITATGVTVRNPTVGTNDTAFRFRPLLTITTNSSYTPKIFDPQVLRVIVGIRFPEIIRIVVDAEPIVLKEAGFDPFEAEQNLHRLQNQGTVTFRRPGDYDDPSTGTDLVTDRTFTGEIEGVTDVMYKTSEGYAHGIELRVKRWITY